jgi:hypothetical protein
MKRSPNNIDTGCPQCGYGFYTHAIIERRSTHARFGHAPEDYGDDSTLLKYERYATCAACGHEVPYRQAYGESN